MNKPQNPYRPRTIIWSIFEGDWSDLTAGEIAQVLGTSPNAIRCYISTILRQTGYRVPRMDGRRRA